MKKLFVLMLAVCLMLGMVACGGNETAPEATETPAPVKITIRRYAEKSIGCISSSLTKKPCSQHFKRQSRLCKTR